MPKQSNKTQPCDLVLEGGGVKGIGLVGAIGQLSAAGYQFRRVAGTSAGAIAGALVAAGMAADRLTATMQTLDYRQFRDPSWLARYGKLGEGLSLALTRGVYRGEYLKQWISGQLAELGVRTFGDLRITDQWANSLPPEQRYRLVVVVSDISQGRMLRLPWDYAKYGLNPDDQLVAEAVRGSMSIPFFYQPARLGKSYLVDGGLLSNFPIDLFDHSPEWPTFGIKLSARPAEGTVPNQVTNIVDYTKAILATATSGHDQMHIDDPCAQARTVFVDTGKIMSTNFDITKADQEFLYQSGKAAAVKFLQTWDFAAHTKQCPAK